MSLPDDIEARAAAVQAALAAAQTPADAAGVHARLPDVWQGRLTVRHVQRTLGWLVVERRAMLVEGDPLRYRVR